MAVKPIPEGFHSITAHVTVKDASAAIEFYQKAFGAQELWRSPGPDGKKIMHAEVKIGDSILMLNDEFPEMGGECSVRAGVSDSVSLHLYVENADAVFEQATKAGASVVMPLADMFWGDRYGMLKDPFGLRWSIATHIKDCTPEEVEKAAAQAFSQQQ